MYYKSELKDMDDVTHRRNLSVTTDQLCIYYIQQINVFEMTCGDNEQCFNQKSM